MTSSWQQAREDCDTLSAMQSGDTSSAIPSLLLYTLLPALVQRRIPKLRSLRRTLSSYETPKTCHARTYSEPANITPPPSYPQSELGDFDDTPVHGTRPTPGRPLSSSSGSATPNEDSRSGGINWRYADPGFSHLSLAAHEAASGGLPSSTFVRRQYIDGIACMLRGLPPTLNEEEIETLREALPSSVLLSPAPEQSLIYHRRFPHTTNTTIHRSTLHQLVALITLYLVLFLGSLLPYLRRAYEYDRQYRISDRVCAKSIEAADVVGKRLVREFRDGKVGDVVRETGVYIVSGVSGGVCDGLGEAMRKSGGMSFGERSSGRKAEQ